MLLELGLGASLAVNVILTYRVMQHTPLRHDIAQLHARHDRVEKALGTIAARQLSDKFGRHGPVK